MDYQSLNDKELLDLLYSEEDRLPRAAVDEFVDRGERMVPLLADIVSNQFNWTCRLPEWWAVVHASFILGAMGTESAVTPLLRALRWADAHDCDWVNEALPSMLGRIGPAAVAPLKTMAADRTNGFFCRSTAMCALGMIAWRHSDRKGEITEFLYPFFAGAENDLDIRKSAGNVLLDLTCGEYKEELLAFGREEKTHGDQDEFYMADFFEDDVERVFAQGDRYMETRDRDWLSFYNEEEIAERRERWRKEDERFQDVNGTVRLTQAKTGRNDPCPCGSGKKYKKCCGP